MKTIEMYEGTGEKGKYKRKFLSRADCLATLKKWARNNIDFSPCRCERARIENKFSFSYKGEQGFFKVYPYLTKHGNCRYLIIQL